jgi:MATE family multidrug resistance protein
LFVGVLCALIFVIFGSTIVGILTDIVAVNEHAGPYLIWIVILPVISAVSYQLDGIFLGATQTSAMRNGMFVSLVVLVVTSFYLVSNFGNHGLWCAFVLFMITRCLTLGLKYKSLENSIAGD